MDRRMFLRSALALAGSAAAFTAVRPEGAKAESLVETLKHSPREGSPAADMPVEGAQEAQYHFHGRPREGWRRHRGWRPRHPYARTRRRCWWRWNRFGQRVRVCA